MKLYSMAGTCALSVHIVLEWIGAPYEVEVMARGDNHADAYLAINPSGQVPALQLDDGRGAHRSPGHPELSGRPISFSVAWRLRRPVWSLQAGAADELSHQRGAHRLQALLHAPAVPGRRASVRGVAGEDVLSAGAHAADAGGAARRQPVHLGRPAERRGRLPLCFASLGGERASRVDTVPQSRSLPRRS